MRAALIILSALLLIGCSTERRCARAVNRCAALWKHDTTFIHDSITRYHFHSRQYHNRAQHD